MKGSLTSEIKGHLDFIAERLWMQPSHACVLVGAGFSRNAIKSDSSVHTPPVWNELADEMLSGLHKADIDKSYMDVLNVADEYVASYGKVEMERFLEEQIPDKSLEPSDLHKMLMSLPWTDVFTTNYDTLLERAADVIVERNYERVINKDKLVLSHSPRIIKLHGSFNSSGSYVISAEDYRRYPIDNASLVNTVQQALIENTLCLFGFSGEDPNFLKWIGWIHDNLGENMPNIYLIGYLNYDDSKRSLLLSRKIIPIDIAPICETRSDIHDALVSVLQYLREKKYNTDDWGKEEILNKDRKSLNLHALEQLYITYPGWKIAPHSKRERILQKLYEADDVIIANLTSSNPISIEIAYYVNWLFEIATLPLLNKYVDAIAKIIGHYSSTESQHQVDKRVVMCLHIALLRAYRERGNEIEWQKSKEIVENNFIVLDSELKSKYYFELCLHDICVFGYAELYRHISLWETTPSSALWQAKRASIKAEFFNINDARKELERALLSIRNSQNLSPIKGDYSALSTESIILFLLGRIKISQKLENWEYPSNEDTYSERMHELSNFYCDPQAELSYMEMGLKPYVPADGIEMQPSYDLHMSNTTFHFEKENKYLRFAIQSMRLMEDLSLPLSMRRVNMVDKVSMKNLVDNIAYMYPNMAAAMILRTGNVNLVSSLISRKTLSQISREGIDEMMKMYILLFKRILTEHTQFAKIHLNLDTVLRVIPEILSRLALKSSYEVRLEMLELLGTYYESSTEVLAVGMDKLAKRLMYSFSDKEKGELIEKLFDFPFPPHWPIIHGGALERDPMTYVYVNHTSITKINAIRVSNVLNKLLCKDEDRKVACWRLYVLEKLGLLDEHQREMFGDNLWSFLDEKNGLPRMTPFNYGAFAQLPHPKLINVIQVLKDYLLNTPFDEDKNGGTSMCRGNFPHWNLMINSKVIDFQWSRKEIRKFVNDIVSWWNTNKKYLLKKDEPISITHSIQEEYECRLIKIIAILSNIVKPNWKFVSSDQKKQLLQIAYESDDYTKYALSIQAVLLPKKRINEHWTEAVIELLTSDDESEVQKASIAIQYVSELGCFSRKCADALSEAFAYNKKTGRSNILVAIREALQYGWHPTEWQQFYLYMGLKSQLMITTIQQSDTELDVETKLYHREKCVEISSLLNKMNDLKDGRLKLVILKWVDIAKDENEFCEIRNAI